MESLGFNGYKPIFPIKGAASFLIQEYRTWAQLFRAQPANSQRFLDEQGFVLANALADRANRVSFMLPEHVWTPNDDPSGTQLRCLYLPGHLREQVVGDFASQLKNKSISATLRQQLDTLQTSNDLAVTLAAGLVRYCTAITLVNKILPAGRTVVYTAEPGDEIPSIPLWHAPVEFQPVRARGDWLECHSQFDDEALSPYVSAARRFFLPQWVAFDQQDHLLVDSLRTAEAYLTSMQNFLRVLHSAISIAPYIAADQDYQQKRNGILGQLVNQGHALARHETLEIVQTILQRAESGDINQGLSLSLLYFDDQALALRACEISVIPTGRISFLPTFILVSCRRERAKITQDTRLSRSTRRHLLEQLRILEHAFERNGN